MSKTHKYDDAVIEYVNAYWRAHYHSPSMREICQECSIPSTSHVGVILSRLQERGLVTLSQIAGHGRGITPMWVALAIEKAGEPDYKVGLCTVEFIVAQPCGCGAVVKTGDEIKPIDQEGCEE